MEPTHRALILDKFASLILAINFNRPIRIAIDGRTASGKSTLTDELAHILSMNGRDVIHTSIDGFHRSRAERYSRGRYSAEGYYYDARDLDAINTLLLVPLGPGGDRLYRTASFDLDNDKPIEQQPLLALNDSILLVDGTFLQRPELRDGWDLTVFVDTSEQTSEQRGIHRDANHLGGLEAAQHLYATRYRPAFNIYESACQPASIADAVFKNDDFNSPLLELRGDGRFFRHKTNILN